MRAGIGFDLHRIVSGRRLVLGGVVIPSSRGLHGHSDADVLIHAVCDAILGGAGLGDIGELFPDTDMRYKNMASSFFLNEAVVKVRKAGYCVVSVDTIVVAEKPRLGQYKTKIRASLAGLLKIKPTFVNVKAKTMEGVGPVGQGKAISAYCVAVLKRRKRG